MPEQEVLKEKQTQNGNLTSGQLPTAKDTDRDSVLRANGSLSTSVDVAQAKLEKSIVQANNYFSGTAKQLQTLREQDSWFRLDRSYIREQIRNLEIELEAQERRIQELKKQLEESRKREEESSRFASEAHELSKQGRLQDAKEKSDKAAASLSLAGSSITNTASIDIDATRASIKASQEISERHLQFEAELAKGERNFSKLGAVENATRLYNYVSSDKGQQEIEGFFSRAYDLITSEETWTKIGDGIVTAATFAKKATVFGAEQLANFAAEVWRDPSKIWTAAATALSVGWQGIKFIAEETGLANLGRGLLALGEGLVNFQIGALKCAASAALDLGRVLKGDISFSDLARNFSRNFSEVQAQFMATLAAGVTTIMAAGAVFLEVFGINDLCRAAVCAWNGDWAGFAINAAFGFPCLLGAGALIKYGVKFAAKKGMKEIGKALGERIVSDIPAHHLKLITSHAGSDAAKASLEQVAKLAEGGALEQAAKKIENVVSREVSLATQQCVKQFPVAKNVCDTFKWLATCKRGEIAKQLQEAGYGKLNSHMTAHCMKRCAVKYGRSGEKALAKGLERGLAESLDSGLRKPIQEQFFKTFDKGLKETAEKLKLSDDAVKAIREAAEKGFDEGFEKGLKRGVRAAIKDGLKQYHKALKKLKHGRFPDFDGPDFLKDRDKNKTPQVAALGLPKTAKLPPAEDLEEVRKKRLPEELTGRKRRLDDDPLPKNLGFDDHLQVAKAREKAKAAREAELTSAAPQARPIKEARNNESNN